MTKLRSPKRALIALVVVCAVAIGIMHYAVLGSHQAVAVTARRHLAVTANPLASEAAREILRKGGSAVDAAIAAQLVLTLVEPQSSGSGGGLFMLVADKKGQARVFDGREVAPGAARPDMFLSPRGKPRSFEEISTGGLAVGVPGAVAAMWDSHIRYGKLPWRDLFAPAIKLAEQGFPITPLLSQAIEQLEPHYLPEATRTIYFYPDGKPKTTGHVIRDPAFAKTLRLLADKGRAGFYEGPVAEAIVTAVRSSSTNPGIMRLADLANYRSIEREALCRPYRSYRVCTTPPPSGGLTLLQMLALLEKVPPSQLEPRTPSQAHLITQASRLAYADRAKWLADPELVPVPDDGLMDDNYLASRSKTINEKRDAGRVDAGTPPVKASALPKFAPHRTPVGHGTSHLAIVDDDGLVVSMTMSVQAAFGSQVRAAGFILNNELTDFSTEPKVEGRLVANAPAANKRPLSAMSPSIVFDPKGQLFAAIGSPGGPDIIGYNARALVDLIDGKSSVSDAVSNPHIVNLNGPTYLEKRLAAVPIAVGLMTRGHSVRFRSLESGLNGIVKVDSGYEGASDVRGEGAAVGD